MLETRKQFLSPRCLCVSRTAPFCCVSGPKATNAQKVRKKMARRYSRRRGKSGSKSPLMKTKPGWLRYSSKEIEMIVSKLAKEGKNASQIGIAMRDIYGVPDVKVATGKRLTHILKDKGLVPRLPDDMTSLIRRSLLIRKHMDSNKKDMTAKRGFQLTQAKINSLAKYYKRRGKIPLDWKYDAKTVKVYIE